MAECSDTINCKGLSIPDTKGQAISYAHDPAVIGCQETAELGEGSIGPAALQGAALGSRSN